jgi:benzoyl-CoA reductase/2-hydroxyglutaryl-CoA dehydratase subunit BcrC/BadD/HgdB
MGSISIAAFERLNERFLLDIESHKNSGGKVVGIYCTFAPSELVRAAGAIPVGLCGKKQDPIPEAEKVLPSNLCPLIKSSYGYASTDTCPFFEASDLLIGETTCDGKKKMFELLRRLKPLYLMHLPYSTEDAHLAAWDRELRELKAFLEEQTGRWVTEEELRRQIVLQNRIRQLLMEIAELAVAGKILLSGREIMTILESRSFVIDQEAYADDLADFKDKLMATRADGQTAFPDQAPRILLTGCPVGKGSDKVIQLVEEGGGVVVCQENCTTLKTLGLMVEENGDPLRALGRRYLDIPCSCMTPNKGRFALIDKYINQFKVQGVIDLTWHCCHTYNVESYFLREHLLKEHGLRLLQVETDYSQGDLEQLRARIEAYLELI